METRMWRVSLCSVYSAPTALRIKRSSKNQTTYYARLDTAQGRHSKCAHLELHHVKSRYNLSLIIRQIPALSEWHALGSTVEEGEMSKTTAFYAAFVMRWLHAPAHSYLTTICG